MEIFFTHAGEVHVQMQEIVRQPFITKQYFLKKN